MFHNIRLCYSFTMTNTERDPGYGTWIVNLMAGRESDADQAVRAAFRAAQTRKTAPAAPRTPAAITVVSTGRNVWAAGTGHGDDALTTFTLLDGPGRFANCTAGRLPPWQRSAMRGSAPRPRTTTRRSTT